jgi:nucleoside-diphosphate-sugar epimerase
MSSKLVLITGATGHIGFKTLLDLFSSGYRARIAVRSEAKEKAILTNPRFLELNLSASAYEFAIVPDITVDGAYHDAIKDVDYVIHIASPLLSGELASTEEYHKFFVEPAVKAAVSILEAANAASSVKRVVITSSVAGLLSFKDFTRPMAEGESFGPEDRAPNDDGPYVGGSLQAYAASKIAALNATEAWIQENKPAFDVVNIHPSFVMGRNELALKPEAAFGGTNRFILVVATGNDFPSPMPGSSVLNDDVARLHVEALKRSIPAGSYIANGPATRWEEVTALVKKLFPEAVKNGTLPNSGKMLSFPSTFDASKTEETFGWKLQGLESQVESVVGHYLELLEASKAA